MEVSKETVQASFELNRIAEELVEIKIALFQLVGMLHQQLQQNQEIPTPPMEEPSLPEPSEPLPADRPEPEPIERPETEPGHPNESEPIKKPEPLPDNLKPVSNYFSQSKIKVI
ncbi:hypothetical protein [Legionella jordanis]|uniref:Uncharacterized protein n=1 Tax=Legionella jordanis TaxID=456 RepID=A0A0W0VD79_9GAMM|nr:hypothetical protein [Legionella jordanis]KTD18062.1 hypothetical protein Ljor_2368 [Legionella jordanis]RMX02253.1 hypothetical protein EAW55_08300 [Legionella jordanis]RMX21262.1 hypothetical protein EAS68_03570 [Legionella jordanis]VEH13846.1 Uncharacterised protein [Legionella jordanis]